MPRQSRKSKVRTFEIIKLRGTPAVLIGLVDAPDEAAAIEAAIEQFRIRPEDQKRLLARPS